MSGHDAIEYAVSCSDLSGLSAPEPAEAGFVRDSARADMTARTFSILAPDIVPPDRHLRAALVWTSIPAPDSNALSDLDLVGFVSDSGTYACSSVDAPVEIIDVPREHVTPGSTYTVTIEPATLRIPPDGTVDYFHYTLGWTWVRDTATVVATKPPAVARGARPSVRPQLRRIGPGTFLVTGVTLEQLSRSRCEITSLDGTVVSRPAPLSVRTTGGGVRFGIDTSRLAAGVYVLRVAGVEGRFLGEGIRE